MQMALHKDVLHKEKQRFEQSWRDEVDLLDGSKQFCEQFIDMVSEFHSMKQLHLGKIRPARHYINVDNPVTLSVLAANYRAG